MRPRWVSLSGILSVNHAAPSRSDPSCLRFEENARYARTASYAQVTEKLYDRSRFRYRAYREQLAPVIPLLAPIISRLGYTID